MTATLIALAVLLAAMLAGVWLNKRAKLQRNPIDERKAVQAETAKTEKEVAHEEQEVRSAPPGKKIDFARALRERGRLRK